MLCSLLPDLEFGPSDWDSSMKLRSISASWVRSPPFRFGELVVPELNLLAFLLM